MKVLLTIVAIMVTNCSPEVNSQEVSFINDDVINTGGRVTRQTSADQMVQNILQWLQGVYAQNSRKIRQGTLREYLPPSNTQKPRPFEPPSNHVQPPGFENNIIGYTPPGSITPLPPFHGTTSPGHHEVFPPDYSPGINGYAPAGETPQPPFQSPSPKNESDFATHPPPQTFPYPPPTFPTVPSTNAPQPFTIPSTFPTAPPTTQQAELSTYPPLVKQPSEEYLPGTNPPVSTERVTYSPPPNTYQPSPTDKYETSPTETYKPTEKVKTPEEPPSYTSPPGDSQPSDGGSVTTLQPPSEEDLKHPPHIHAIDVECAKDMMTINIEFNRRFDGVIYSKGFYNRPECVYVTQNSGLTKYSFTVSLDSCGTEFISAFDTQGQSYLENILVLQNEAGIQEVWDTIRSVRCLWEGNLNKALSVSLSVGMLSQEIVTFSGDTAVARLDIQLGKGPFAPTATGLVKIGEQMTLVVSVTGDPGFDIQVKQCKAVDSSGVNEVELTDDDGCVLKPKLFGAFQKTRNTENTGASIIAYAFFNAFKFPDIMDLMIECNVELCKTDCQICEDSNQKLEPGRRRRRDLLNENNTLGEPVTVRKILKVLLPEDLSNGEAIVSVKDGEDICISRQGFVISSVVYISLLTFTTLFCGYLWLKNQRRNIKI